MTRTLNIAKNRLIDTIHYTAQWGAKTLWGPEATQTGMCRLALSDEDKQVRDWFVAETKLLGCEVRVDELGNIFAIYPGKKQGAPIGIGLHLDTQPTGGRYDGILGVLAGLEVLRTLKDNDYVPEYPIAVVDWMNEEGARFPRLLMALAVWAGNFTKEDTYAETLVLDTKPVTVLHELERIGYKGTTPVLHTANPLAAHFELHIEQGPVLENEQKRVGIVTGVQAYVWNKVKVYGKAQHTGTTPLAHRRDALLTAAQMMVKANEIAAAEGGLALVGIVTVGPALANVIPEECEFILDVRHVEDRGMKAIVDACKKEFATIAEAGNRSATAKPLLVAWEHIYTLDAVNFAPECILCVREAAAEVCGDLVREIVLGAGHDLCSTLCVVPTLMVFIPSLDGVLHNPEEYSTPEQVNDGFEVLLNAVLKYDLKRTQ